MADAIRENLDLLFAFEDWAKQSGLCVERNADNSGFTHINTAASWLGFQAAHGPFGCQPEGQNLLAEIKKNSRYASQIEMAKRKGQYPFTVRICSVADDYCVQGGPGGQYRLSDVNLYVFEGGKKCRIK